MPVSLDETVEPPDSSATARCQCPAVEAEAGRCLPKVVVDGRSSGRVGRNQGTPLLVLRRELFLWSRVIESTRSIAASSGRAAGARLQRGRCRAPKTPLDAQGSRCVMAPVTRRARHGRRVTPSPRGSPGLGSVLGLTDDAGVIMAAVTSLCHGLAKYQKRRIG